MNKSQKILTVLLLLAGAVVAAVVAGVSIMRGKANVRRENILEYARENYPDAEIVAEEFPYKHIFFELNGVRFIIRNDGGEYFFDNYGYERMRKIVTEELLDGFFKPRGLECSPRIYFTKVDPANDDDLSTFEGEINLEFTLDYEEGKPTPHYLGWLYDFYLYWDEVCPSEKYVLQINYYADSQKKKRYHLYYFPKLKTFYSEEEFYAAFDKY